ncbi:MAG: hypothetical protein NTY09_02305 [bacterium]|nr:hypothetical protein [bacterium]
MTRENPIVPNQDHSGNIPVSIPEVGESLNGMRVAEKIGIISDYRMKEEMPVAELAQQVEKLLDQISGIFSEGKKLRLERVELIVGLEKLHKQNLDFKKGRLKKESRVATLKSRCTAVKMEISNEGPSEVERLKKRKSELESDIAMFQETFEVHRRDRSRTLTMLQNKNSMLQDIYTEKVLEKIIAVRNTGEENSKVADLRGLTAELLGRLLVLEREESYLFGIYIRSLNGEIF